MSTLTPGAPVLSLVAPSVTPVQGGTSWVVFFAPLYFVAPEPTVILTMTPGATAVTKSAPSVQVNRTHLAQPVRVDLNAVSVAGITLGKPPLKSITPSPVALSLVAVAVDKAKVDKRIGPSIIGMGIDFKTGTVSVDKGTATLVPDALPLVLTAAGPALLLDLPLSIDPTPLSFTVPEVNAAVDVLIEPDEFPSKPWIEVLDPTMDFGEKVLEPEATSVSHAVPSPSVLPGEKVLAVGPTALVASVGAPVVTEGVGQIKAPCLINNRPDVKCMVNVSEVAYVETDPE